MKALDFSILPRLPSGARRHRPADPSGGVSGAPDEGQLFLSRLGVILAVFAVGAFSIVLKPSRVVPPYVVGQIADRSIYSEQPFEYEDWEETQRQQDEAARRMPPVFVISRTDVEGPLGDFAALGTVLGAGSPAASPAAGQGAGEPPRTVDAASRFRADAALEEVTDSQRMALEHFALTPGKWTFLERQFAERLRQGVADEEELDAGFDGLIDEQGTISVVDEASRRTSRPLADVLTPGRATRELTEEISRTYPDEAEAIGALTLILPRLIVPNLEQDELLTQKARQQAAAQIPIIRRDVKAGELLLRRGERITRGDLVRLEKYLQQTTGMLGPLEMITRDLLVAALFLLILVCAAYFLHAMHPEGVGTVSGTLCIGVIVIGQILLIRATGDLYYRYWGATAVLLPVVLPLSFAAMLLAQLIGLRAAVWGGLLTAVVAAFQFHDPFQILVVGVLSSFTAAVLMRRSRRRLHALRAGLGVGAVAALVSTVFLVQARVPVEFIWNVVWLTFINGMLCAMVAVFVTPALEYLFGLTTDLALLELSDLNHPLLKRLQLEAPGTYHHSLLVAALAEEAAAAVGANPLLARVCAYFHDIGKLTGPEYFTENAMGEDPHEELEPHLSSRMIMEHVKCGLELAAKYKLKPVIREAIAQHHGTNLVYYFYRQAVTRQEADADPAAAPVGEQEYRYPGPLPERKEIVILEIADCCEAATRSIERPTRRKILAMVEELIRKRIDDGQFARADLTFAELSVVQETVIKSLTNMLHGRIRYPKEEKDDHDGTGTSGTNDAGAADSEPEAAHGSAPADDQAQRG